MNKKIDRLKNSPILLALFGLFVLALWCIEKLSPWPFIERRHTYAYVVNGRRWYELEPTRAKNNTRFQIITVASAGIVTFTAIIMASNSPLYLLVIPAFSIYTVSVIFIRQIKLQTASA